MSVAVRYAFCPKARSSVTCTAQSAFGTWQHGLLHDGCFARMQRLRMKYARTGPVLTLTKYLQTHAAVQMWSYFSCHLGPAMPYLAVEGIWQNQVYMAGPTLSPPPPAGANMPALHVAVEMSYCTKASTASCCFASFLDVTQHARHAPADVLQVLTGAL
eukprot:351585-Chlamydomonas_euryale.AAC.2